MTTKDTTAEETPEQVVLLCMDRFHSRHHYHPSPSDLHQCLRRQFSLGQIKSILWDLAAERRVRKIRPELVARGRPAYRYALAGPLDVVLDPAPWTLNDYVLAAIRRRISGKYRSPSAPEIHRHLKRRGSREEVDAVIVSLLADGQIRPVERDPGTRGRPTVRYVIEERVKA